MRDTSINHFHTDPILVYQPYVRNTLQIGQLVYLDSSNFYKPAIATSRVKSNVQGIVWHFVNRDYVYIKTQPGPLFYRFPFVPNWFVKADGVIQENALLYSKVPGSMGEKLFLSDTIPGGMTNFLPKSNLYRTLVGIKTDYGVLFRIEPYCVGNSFSTT